MAVAQADRVEINWPELCQFTPRQQEAARAVYTHRYILYGGARGGGKSRFLRWMMIEYLIHLGKDLNIPGARAMLACETYPDLRDRQITKFPLEFPQWLGKLKDSKEQGLAFHLAEAFGGGVLALRNLDDPSKYQSSEFVAIAVDELTKIQRDTFDILRGSLRWPGVEHTVFMGATNPGSIGHAWVKALWIDRQFPSELRQRADEFAFIQSLPADNPYLSQSYWDELNSLPENLRRAWVDGDWQVFSGMAFPSWSTEHACDPFDIPEYWPRYIGIDWGYAKPFACVGVTVDPDTGRRYLYREIYKAGLTDQQQARAVRETFADEKIKFRFADPSMWAKKTQVIVTSTADVYAGEGVILEPAENDRLAGKRKIDRLLMPLADGKPALVVFKDCKHSLRTIPLLAYSTSNPEDVDTDQEDHAYDALRYALTSAADERKRKPVNKQSNPFAKRGYL